MDNAQGNYFLIRLDDLRFHSRIGVFEQERKVGNEFVVDLCFRINADSFESERLDTTVSYADAYDVIKKIMSQEWLLLESVAKEIGSTILLSDNKIEQGSVRIRKLSVPISGMCGSASVEYFFKKSD